MSPGYLAASTPTDGPGWFGILVLFAISLLIGAGIDTLIRRRTSARRDAARRNHAHRKRP